MPSPEDQALAAAEAAPRGPDGALDLAVYQAAYERALAERQQRLLTDARASFRAMDGWERVKSEADWEATVARAGAARADGSFLIERLGGQRHVDPDLAATLLVLRRQLADEHGATTAAELILIDNVVLAYYHTIRLNGWIGDLATLVEAEFFGMSGPSARFREGYGAGADNIRGLKVEDALRRLGEQLYPLVDRANRMLVRNLKALRALREPSGPSVSIGKVGQMNVAATQANAVLGGAADGRRPGTGETA